MHTRRWAVRTAAALVLVWTTLAGLPARANGNYFHIWMARDARRFLPAGELRDLLNDPARVEILRNGARNPDGGHAVDDGYGELSHWEPFGCRSIGSTMSENDY